MSTEYFCFECGEMMPEGHTHPSQTNPIKFPPCDGCRRKSAHIQTLEKIAREAHAAWWRAESNRGCYSCVAEHDLRCYTNWKKPEPCNCGRVELDAAMACLASLAGKGE